jgi:hypothetical protein
MAGSDLFNNEEVEGTEGGGDHHEAVAGRHDFGMIADEGQPGLFRVRGAHRGPSLRRYLPTVRWET